MRLKYSPVGGVTPEDVGMEAAVGEAIIGFDYYNRKHDCSKITKKSTHKWVVFLPKTKIQLRYW